MTYGHEHGAEQFVGHDTPAQADKADSFVYAELTAVGETPIRWEQLPARCIHSKAQTFEICCVPFFTYGLALGDVVTSDGLEAHGLVDRVVTGIAEPSGHLTLRAHFVRSTASAQERNEMIGELTRLGCVLEEWSARMIAIDASPSIVHQVIEILESWMTEFGIEWERANFDDAN